MIRLLRKKDPVELVVFLLGCFLVVMVAFFVARGDLDAYTDYLMGSSFGMETISEEQRARELVAELERRDDAVPAEETVPVPPTEEVAPPAVAEVSPPSFPEVAEDPPPAPAVRVVEAPPSTPAVTQPERELQPVEGEYYVQCGAFGQRDNAERMAETLREYGLNPVILQEGNIHKVQITGFPGMDEARAAVQRLQQQGIEAFAGR